MCPAKIVCFTSGASVSGNKRSCSVMSLFRCGNLNGLQRQVRLDADINLDVIAHSEAAIERPVPGNAKILAIDGDTGICGQELCFRRAGGATQVKRAVNVPWLAPAP